MVMTFGDRDLKDLFETGRSKRISGDLQKRALRALTAIAAAANVRNLDPGFRTHPLVGTKPLRHSMWVGATWRITFIVLDGGATADDLRLVQYH